MNENVKTNIGKEEIVLAPPTELYDEAREIGHTSVGDEKFPFMIQYDSNQKEFLLSMLETVGSIVENDDEEGCVTKIKRCQKSIEKKPFSWYNYQNDKQSEVQGLVVKLQEYITRNYYTCSNETLAGLGQMHVADERFNGNIDKYDKGIAEFVAESIELFCNK